MATLVGHTVSHYRILELLGGGGMGVVYKAQDLKLDRSVALKFLPPDLTRDPDARERFTREAKAASALQHTNICTVHDIDHTDDGQIFIVMDCYDGETLREKIARGPVRIEDTVDIVLQAARGLRKAHENGIIHRDIKPANIIITTDGTVKILDFGLAKLGEGSVVSATGSTLGTVAYMSPEQTRGQAVDRRTDIWSLGVVMYEMLTGERPFKGEYSQVLIYSILNQSPPTLTGLPDHAASLGTVVMQCLEKDPAKRIQSADGLSRAIVQAVPWASAGTTSRRLSEYRFGAALSAFGRRPRYLIPAAVGLILVAVLVSPLRKDLARLFGAGQEKSETHLAVLVDPTGQGNEPLCWGIVDVLTERIARLHKFDPSLWVIPASEIQKEKVNTASEARKTFGATLAIMVRALRTDKRIRLTLNLIDATSLRLIDSQDFEDPIESLPALENRAREKAAALLDIPIPAAEAGVPGSWVSPGIAYDSYLQGRGYLKRHDREQDIDLAIEMFLSALRLDTAYAVARAGLAEAYWRKYEATKDTQWVRRASEECAHAQASGNPSPEIYSTSGLICNGTGDYVRAVSDYTRAVDLDPDNADAVLGLGNAVEHLNDPRRAEELYRKAIALQPASWGSHNLLGAFYARQGRYADAIEPFQKVIALTPNNTRGYSNLGGMYLYLGRYPDAEKAFEQSISIMPTYAALSNLGTAYFKERRFKDAAVSYAAALKINDREFALWGNLGAAYFWTPGKRDTAIAVYNRAIEKAREALTVNRNNAGALAALAGYYSDVGSTALAVKSLKEALALAPDDGEVLYMAGCVYEEMGDRTKALDFLSRALDHGYSFQEIEDYPGLDNLRKDRRFAEIGNRK